ncbi:hypothetical protein QS468_34790 [Bacillus subtilis]|nr:hypothetical protein [Bacillus subtilis]
MAIIVFFHGQHLTAGKMQIAIPTLARRQRLRLAIQRLAIQLLIRLVDENHAIRRQTKRPTAIFVHTATHAETRRRQTFRHAIAPVPDPARSVCRPVFIPEQTMGAELQFGEIHTGCNRGSGAERLSLWR